MSLLELISAEESWTVTVVLPSFGLSERGEVVRWREVVGLVMLRWLWIGRNVFGGAVVGLQGPFMVILIQSRVLILSKCFRFYHYEQAQPLVFHLMGRLRSLEVKY